MRPPKPDPKKPGQESVWEFPRPAVAQPQHRRLRVEFAGVVVAQTEAGFRTLETSHPPTYYFPPADVNMALLQRAERSTMCEWKGRAVYYDVVVGSHRAALAAWAYPQPTPAFALMRDHIAFYANKMTACFVDEERVTPQPGQFYGGWVTSAFAGPFKGIPGSDGW